MDIKLRRQNRDYLTGWTREIRVLKTDVKIKDKGMDIKLRKQNRDYLTGWPL